MKQERKAGEIPSGGAQGKLHARGPDGKDSQAEGIRGVRTWRWTHAESVWKNGEVWDVEAWGTWRTFEEYEAEKLDWAHRPNSLGFTLAAEGSSEQLWAEVTWSELDLMETNCGWSMHSGWVLWGVKRVRLRRPAGRPLRDCSLL